MITTAKKSTFGLSKLALISMLTFGSAAYAQNMQTQETKTAATITITEGYLQGADNNIFYREVSPANGNAQETIIYLHGGPGFDMNDGGLEFDNLGDKYRFIAYDQRGGGYSQEVTDLTADSHVADIEAIREHFGLEKFTLMGQSWGSGLGMMYAEAHPERLNRLVLLSPMPIRETMWNYRFAQTGKLLTDQQNADFLQAAIADLSNATAEEVIANCNIYIPLIFVPYLSPVSDWANMKGDYCDSDIEGMKRRWGNNGATMASIPGFDWRDAATNFDAPTYILDGEWSMVPLNTTREWGAYLPNSRVEIIEDAGHLVWLDAPARLEQSLRRFLKDEWPKNAVELEPTELDLLSRYTFDGTMINDMDNRFHPETIGAITFGKDRFGNADKTAQFGLGVSSLDVASPDWSAEPKNWTWTAWVKLGVNSNDARTILAQGDTVKVNAANGKVSFSVGDATIEDTNSIGGQTWTHIAAVQDGNNISLYRDGQFIGQASGADLPALTGDFAMANTGGALDDVRIYSGSLNAERIQAVYNKQ